MSDGIRFEVAARSLHAQYHARHFGPRRGVTLHDMISDQYSHPYIQIIPPHMREAHAALGCRIQRQSDLRTMRRGNVPDARRLAVPCLRV